MSLSAQLYKSIRSLPDCIAGGYIDLDNKNLVCMLSMESQPREVLERLVGVTEDLFQGPNVLMIEDIFRKARNDDRLDGRFFREMTVMNQDLTHIFLRGHSNKSHVVTFVSTGEVNVVHSLAKARAEVYKLEAAFRADLAKGSRPGDAPGL